HSFADHAPYSKVALQRLLKEAVQKNAQLVTTEKDAARLPASFRPQVLAFPVRLIFEDDSKLENLLKNAGVRLK
ncbi:MAG TPA: tetraacyldisaccharide 4'-kinase, partial [Rhodobacteraceae bacterium]|nr:tetraacyldisaccharide 4'-kinase [Paracoccaceae bacterium]